MEQFIIPSWLVLDFSNTLLMYISIFLLIPNLYSKRNVILSFSLSLLFTFIDFYFPNASLLLTFFTYLLFLKQSKLNINLPIQIILFLVSFLLTSLTQGIASYFVIKVFNLGFSVYSFKTLLGTILLTLINYTLTLLIIIILKFILHLDTIQNIIHNKTVIKMALLSTIVITVSYASLILMSRHEFNQLTYLKTTLLVSLMSTIFIVIGSIMLVMGYMKEVRSKYEIRHLKERNLYIEELERKNTELRRFKHDYKNLLTSLSVSLRSNNSNNDSIQRLLDYADSNVDMTSTVENANLYHLNDDLVKGIIITKLVAAKNKHIETNFEVDQSILIPKTLSVEITRILGILFDNAIEASLLTNNPEISFALVTFDSYLEFIVKNNIASSEKINLDQIYQTGYTSKKDHNGLGLSTVNKIIHSNSNLLLQNKVKDGYFSTILTILEDK
ncbi:hypothetical protein LKI01_22460 [Companilactobacillus paralimentarius]|uniref:Sensor histidine kinase NatK-like C-terminal domain-containing protein n=5 Tax=Companilactobacillus kimchii TaxID=2801452 RepID=A0A210P688_9LACO|nr:hypothetical protein LKACC12383_02518 [Companilactobacillus kimchii]GEO48247.1 hypothetical protein LKI01_22460 [Companilactobacillus paralimentarius]